MCRKLRFSMEMELLGALCRIMQFSCVLFRNKQQSWTCPVLGMLCSLGHHSLSHRHWKVTRKNSQGDSPPTKSPKESGVSHSLHLGENGKPGALLSSKEQTYKPIYYWSNSKDTHLFCLLSTGQFLQVSHCQLTWCRHIHSAPLLLIPSTWNDCGDS